MSSPIRDRLRALLDLQRTTRFKIAASIVIGVTADPTARISAVDLVRKASEVLGGKGGGGKPDMAQAGGTDPAKAPGAIAAARALLAD